MGDDEFFQWRSVQVLRSMEVLPLESKVALVDPESSVVSLHLGCFASPWYLNLLHILVTANHLDRV